MWRKIGIAWALFLVAGAGAHLSGCGRAPAPGPVVHQAPRSTADPAAAAFLLAEEPEGARGVKAVVADSALEGEVVVVGRIGGEVKPFFEGQTAFLLTDRSLLACTEIEGDTCPTPWDFCCVPRGELAAGTLTVKLVDEDGKPLSHSARDWLGVVELDTVVARGWVERADDGSVTLLARGLYLKH